MLQFRRAALGVITALAATVALTTTGTAESVAEFYQGKTIAIVMGTGPGGSYDLYARTIAAHLSKHIPGNPNIIVEHLPGAGGAIAGNHTYGVAPQDGTKSLETHALPLIEALQGGKGIQFKSDKFNWLGAYDSISQVMALWHTAPAQTIDELKTKDMVLGAFNKGHLSYHWAMLAKNVLGAKYKVIIGYRSGNDLNLAMERGEVNGWAASWANLTATKQQWLRDKKVVTPVQFALEREHDLPNVPTLLELSPPDQKAIVEFIASGQPIARAMAVGPGVPADRVAALRKAFDELMQDQDFLADCAKRKLSIRPRSAAQVAKLVHTITSASPELVARVKKSIGLAE